MLLVDLKADWEGWCGLFTSRPDGYRLAGRFDDSGRPSSVWSEHNPIKAIVFISCFVLMSRRSWISAFWIEVERSQGNVCFAHVFRNALYSHPVCTAFRGSLFVTSPIYPVQV